MEQAREVIWLYGHRRGNGKMQRGKRSTKEKKTQNRREERKEK